MAVSLVVAWDSDLQEPLAARRAANKRHAQSIAEELRKEYPWSPRISFYQEVDFLATEAGMTPAETQRAKEHLTQRYSAEEIRHARELQQTGSTDITDLVKRSLEGEGQIASRDWHTRAIVRILETTVKHSHWDERTFQAGEAVEMVQWGRAGRPVERDSWWTSFDIDGAFIIETDKVEVVRIIQETPPFDQAKQE